MKYCSKCKQLYFGHTEERCQKCGKKLIENPGTFSPVGIVTANGFELERIKAALDDAEIAYSVQQTKQDTGIQILNSAPPENCTIYVPLCDYDTAVSTLVGISAINDNPTEKMNDDDIDKINKAKKNAVSEEMSPQKRFWVKLLSFLGFLLILAAAVYLTDFITASIKTVFGM